jgi:predicted PurR-regulated permease PerM
MASQPLPVQPPTTATAARALNVNIMFRTMVVVTAILALAWVFIFVRAVMLSLFLALFAALVLEPVVRVIERKLSLSRGRAATLLVLGLVVVGIVILAFLLAPVVSAFRDFAHALPSIVSDARNSSTLASWLDKHSNAPDVLQAHAKEIVSGIAKGAGGVIGVGLSTLSAVLGAVTLIFLTLFLMIDLPRIVGAVDSLCDPRRAVTWHRTSERIITAVSRTMLGNIAISVICGAIYGLSAWALGAPFPLVLGIVAALLDMIPMIGATLAGTILVLATLTQGLTPALIMLGIVLVYQQFENYVLQPTILGKAANVSGFMVIASVMLFGALFGVVGAIIAVPIVASIQIVMQELTADRRARMAALRASASGDTPAIGAVTR